MRPADTAATYGELTELAMRRIAAGRVLLATTLLSVPAEEVLSCYWRVQQVLARHTRIVAGLDRYPMPTAWDQPRTSADAAIRSFLDTITTTAGPDLAHKSAVMGQQHPWAQAAVAWQCASDLLATHFEPGGQPRSPDSARLDDVAGKGAALARVAAAMLTMLDAREHLRLRVAQAGVPWAEVMRLLPDSDQHDRTREAAARVAVHPRAGVWDTQSVARPSVAADDPWRELADRTQRLRRWAWQLSHEHTPSVRPLGEIALAAVAVHQLASRIPTLPGPVRARIGQETIAWATVRDELHRLQTPALSVLGPRVDARAVGHLATALAARTSPAQLRDTQARVLYSALDGFQDIAGWNLYTVTKLVDHHRLYTRGRYLTGDDVSDHPELVSAKLTDAAAAQVPSSHIGRLVDAYAIAAEDHGYYTNGLYSHGRTQRTGVQPMPSRHVGASPAMLTH